MLKHKLKTKVIIFILLSLILAGCSSSKMTMKDNDALRDILSDYTELTEEYKGVTAYAHKKLWMSYDSCISPFVVISSHGGSASLDFKYVGTDFIDIKNIIVETDSHKYRVNFKKDDLTQEVESYPIPHVEETVFCDINKKHYKMLVDIANSSNTRVSYTGNDTYSYKLSDVNKEAIKTLVSCYEEP